jgi:conjugative relaxase-like TrwC/TraI family protein
MIRMVQSISADQAKAYFNDALSKSDYFINDQELAGKLQGRLSDRLGLDSKVSKEVFFALSENLHPRTGKPLTPRTYEGRRVGYDINFHCPKSVSIVHALSKDNHILDAFEASVTETMKAIEADSKTRVRRNGADEDRKTGELVWAEFTHQTARPVDGLAPDPHLHAHCFCFNMTFDSEEQKIKAGQFGDIKKDMPYYQALFHKTFSDKLIVAGFQIKRTGKSFELEGVPQKAIDLFSKRTNEIGQFAKKHGITSEKELAELGARTRSKKQKGFTMSELKKLWRDQITALGESTDIEKNQAIRFGKKEGKPKILAHHCIDHAIKHTFERVSVMQGRRILETAFKYGIGDNSVTVTEIDESFNADKRIISIKENHRLLCTTKEVLKEERKMVELATQGKGQLKPLYLDMPAMKLKGQQADAIAHILSTKDRVSIIIGAAGAGKTTLMKEAVEHIEFTGKKVVIVAPTAEASKGVLVDEGFKNATTVANLLQNKAKQTELKDQVLWVDEAGLLGTKDMTALLQLATQRNARLILGGDTRQHSSVVRGDALRILNKVAKIAIAEVNQIRRQKTTNYRDAVQDLSQGSVRSAFEKLSNIGAIQEIDPLKPNEDLINDYVDLIKKKKSALIISPTHKQGEEVTDAVRKKFRDEGLIGKKEIKVTKLDNLNLTEAQKSDLRIYKPGQMIKFNQNLRRIKRGSLWTVKNVDGNAAFIINDKGDEKKLPHKKPKSYDLLEMSEMGLSKGDKIKITRNGFDVKKKRLNNGQTLEVIEINKSGKIKAKNREGKTIYNLDKDFGHLIHAHCITSYAAQGKTVDHVLISQPASTFPATDAKQFYVSVSRARESVRIYTDDRNALLEYASQLAERQSAIEIVGKKNSHLGQVLEQKRKEYPVPEKTNTKQKTRFENISMDRE